MSIVRLHVSDLVTRYAAALRRELGASVREIVLVAPRAYRS
jgi:hypothetical protein